MALENEELENEEQPTEEEIEAEAREMGWKPLDEFNGNPDDWRDAAEFVERGKNILPIVQAHNRKLREQVLTQRKELDSLKETVEGANKAIQALRKGYDESVAKEVAQAKKDLRAQLVEAREIGDIDAELDAQEKLEELKESEKASKQKASEDSEEKKSKPPALHPEFQAWKDENSWFGDEHDPDNLKKTKQLLLIGEELRLDGDESVGRKFMDKCVAELEKRTKSPSKKSGTKVESGSHGVVAGGGRPFNSLPKQAREICHDDNDKFVGPGKMFKTVAEWENHFAELYLNSGE